MDGDREISTDRLVALEPVVRRYLAKWIDDGDDLDDVAQRSLIRIWRGLDSYEGRAALTSWAYRIARNEFVSWRRGRPAGSCSSIPDEYGSVPSPESRILARIAVTRWLGALDVERRRLIRLLYLCDMNSFEAAQELGVAASTVRCAHRRILRQSSGTPTRGA